MIRDGESRSPIIDKLGGGMLGLKWDPISDYINMHLAVNLSHKKENHSQTAPSVSMGCSVGKRIT